MARLATTGAGGALHVVPISPVLDRGKLYFATGEGTAKVRNIRADPRVALVFDEYTEVWSALKQVMIQGHVRVIASGPRFAKYRRLLYAKYLQYEPEAAIEEGESIIVEVTIDRVVSSGL